METQISVSGLEENKNLFLLQRNKLFYSTTKSTKLDLLRDVLHSLNAITFHSVLITNHTTP